MTTEPTAPLALERAIEEALERFRLEHGALVRRACSVDASLVDLTPVVVTTFYGHMLGRLVRQSGVAHVERLTAVLLEQLEALAPSEAVATAALAASSESSRATSGWRCGSCRDTGFWSTGIACPVCGGQPPPGKGEMH